MVPRSLKGKRAGVKKEMEEENRKRLRLYRRKCNMYVWWGLISNVLPPVNTRNNESHEVTNARLGVQGQFCKRVELRAN
jgi:hypothetical protein